MPESRLEYLIRGLVRISVGVGIGLALVVVAGLAFVWLIYPRHPDRRTVKYLQTLSVACSVYQSTHHAPPQASSMGELVRVLTEVDRESGTAIMQLSGWTSPNGALDQWGQPLILENGPPPSGCTAVSYGSDRKPNTTDDLRVVLWTIDSLPISSNGLLETPGALPRPVRDPGAAPAGRAFLECRTESGVLP